MKKVYLLIVTILMPLLGLAQEAKDFTTFIYTDAFLSNEIQRKSQIEVPISYGGKVWDSTVDAVKGIGSGYVTSFMDLGVNAVASLFTRNSRHKVEWEKMIAEEDTWTTTINTVEEVKDFYKEPSKDGALDPNGLFFNGIGCLRMEGNDTVFFISCHINREKLNRIIDHSKFELVLDTLKISPLHSNLPNTLLPIKYSFKDRKDFVLSVNIKLSSSWFTESIELQKNIKLGEFSISIPINPDSLDAGGYLRYARGKNETPRYKILGESFIVPRSYMGHRNHDGSFSDSWGTGEYHVDVTLTETCDITDSYRKGWKADRKRRKAMKQKVSIFKNIMQTVSNQKWDELSEQWVITTLSAPVGVISDELIDQLGLKKSTSATTDQSTTNQALQ